MYSRLMEASGDWIALQWTLLKIAGGCGRLQCRLWRLHCRRGGGLLGGNLIVLPFCAWGWKKWSKCYHFIVCSSRFLMIGE